MRSCNVSIAKCVRYACLLAITGMGLCAIVGSNGAAGGGGATLGTSPIINSALLYNAADLTTPTLSFTIGDLIHVEVEIVDPDINCCPTLLVSQFFQDETVATYTDAINLPNQTQATDILLTIDPLEILGPAGNWRFELAAEDARGLTSDVFIIDMVVVAE